jgi:4-amino-4-deoxy-L-arabinose transferase-like glycosyltransferase
MPTRRSLWIVCLVAVLNGLFFMWYQSRDWTTLWTDQDGYRRLGEVLADTGKFTRFPDATPFVPEVIRTPAYPMFVAIIYKLFGVGQVPVALAQTALFVGICLLMFATARRLTSERTAWLAALFTALFPAIPYFVPLVMTEVWTTLWFTVTMWLAIRTLDDRRARTFAMLGIAAGITALSRPAFVLFPFALAAVGIVVLPFTRRARRPSLINWTTMLAAFAVTMLPWFTYNYVTLGSFTLSPAGGVGRGIWEGSWQATWSGRLQDELTDLAGEVDDRDTLDRRVTAVAAREGLPAGPMLDYVHQWKDIRRIWTEPTDANERARARVAADREYLRVGLENIRRNSTAHLVTRLARGVFILWAGEIPIRYSDINRMPPAVIRIGWAIQALIVAAAMCGLVVFARGGRADAAALLAAPIVYVTAVHFPLLKEARQSLPALPTVLLLATVALDKVISPRRGISPPLA